MQSYWDTSPATMLQTALVAVGLLGLCWCSPLTLDIDATTTYVNNVVEILYSPGDAVIFTAPTCGYYDTGYDVTIQVYNPHNPTNDPNMGIVYFAATNKMTNGTIAPADIICSVDHTTPYATKCTGVAGKGDLYVVVTGNNKYFLNFALSVTFAPKDSLITRPHVTPKPFHVPSPEKTSTQELHQAFIFDRVIELEYGNSTLIHLRICPSKLTTDKYTVTSILQADDPESKSLIAQSLCKTSSCTFDTTPVEGRVGLNSRDLPVNVAQSDPGKYNDIYIYAVAYNGVLTNGWPLGMFKFGATVTKTS